MDTVASGKTDYVYQFGYRLRITVQKVSIQSCLYKPEKVGTGYRPGSNDRIQPVLLAFSQKAIYGISADSLPDILSWNSVRPRTGYAGSVPEALSGADPPLYWLLSVQRRFVIIFCASLSAQQKTESEAGCRQTGCRVSKKLAR